AAGSCSKILPPGSLRLSGQICRRLESWCPYTGMQSGACHPATTGFTGSVPFPQFNRTIRPLKKSKTVHSTVTLPSCPSRQSENNHLRYSDTPYPPSRKFRLPQKKEDCE